MKNADPQDVVIVLGVYVLIISIVSFAGAAVWADQMTERGSIPESKAHSKTVGGEMGYSMLQGQEGNIDETGG